MKHRNICTTFELPMLFSRDEYYLIDDILDESSAGVAPRASLHPAAEHFFSKLAGDNPCQIKPDRGIAVQ